jgi:carbon starvation protein
MFYETTAAGRTVLHAMPLLAAALCVLAIAYRYYSAFLAAKVAALDDSRPTPAHLYNDGQNYHPTNKWVLFGHHFAAISGAGPLIGPVLAIQYGYMPGLLWLVIGVTLAGAVQDMLVLAASVRCGGKSLAEIARAELGSWANIVVSSAILFIVVIALAGLGFVVVKALGGEEVPFPAGTRIEVPAGGTVTSTGRSIPPLQTTYDLPGGCTVYYPSDGGSSTRSEPISVRIPIQEGDKVPPVAFPSSRHTGLFVGDGPVSTEGFRLDEADTLTLPAGSLQVVKGSSWGTFTIACTIPIALLTGLYMYRLRKGHVIEASLLGAALTLGAVVAGNWIPGSALEACFSLTKTQTILAITIYGIIASVLPVWLLLAPRDYLSSFLKIGTIALLVVGVFAANPVLPCPPINEEFLKDGPTFRGGLFPFVFICIMCGAISGFHSLVASGTTPKMIDKERQVRGIGYGAMLMEGLVGIVALFSAASLDPKLYYDINVANDQAGKWQPQLDRMYQQLGTVDTIEHLNLGQVEGMVGGESLRGRTGGAVTLAVGMSLVLAKPLNQLGLPFDDLVKYWYHFAIMFEALFILTTIDAGTRISRFLLQEVMGKVRPEWGRTDWLPGAIFSSVVVTAGWGLLVYSGSIDTIWPMFGIANQLLSVIALTLVTTWLFNTGRGRYAPVTILPMLFVCATTLTAGTEMAGVRFPAMIRQGQVAKGALNLALTVFVVACVATLLLLAVSRWLMVARGIVPVRKDEPPQVAADPLGNGADRTAVRQPLA